MKNAIKYFVLVMALALAACGGGDTGSPNNSDLNTDDGNDSANEDNSGAGNTDTGIETVPSAWGVTSILSDSTKSSLNPDVAMDETGAAVAVWVEDSTPDVVRSAYLPAGGTSWQAAEQIDGAAGTVTPYYWSRINYSRTNPQVAINNNVAVAAWIQSDGNHLSVFANRRDLNGWGTATPLEMENAGDAKYVRVIVDDAGNATVVWTQSRIDDDEPAVILSATYSEASTGWGAVIPVSSIEATNHASSVQLKLARDGKVAMVWAGAESATTGLYYSVLSNTSWRAPEMIAQGVFASFSLAMSSDNNEPAVAMSRNDAGGHYSIEFSRRNGDAGWTMPVAIEEVDFNAYSPSLVAMPDGGFMLAWQQHDGSSGTDYFYYDAYVRQYMADAGWQTAVRLDDLGGTLPRLAADNAGNAVCLWYETHTYESHFTNGSWSTLSKPFGGTYVTGYNLGTEQHVVMNGSGRAVAIWTSGSTPARVETAIYE